MNTLLIFFAFPIAVIIISFILQKVLHNPIAVASLIFAIFIIVTFAAFDEMFLIATLAYTILSFITALLAKIFCNRRENNSDNELCDILKNILNNISQNSNNNNETDNDNENVSEAIEQILNNSNNNNNNNNNSSNCGCNRYRRRF